MPLNVSAILRFKKPQSLQSYLQKQVAITRADLSNLLDESKLRRRKAPHQALSLSKALIEAAKISDDNLYLAKGLEAKGLVLITLAEFKEAEETINEAIQVITKHGSELEIAITKSRLLSVFTFTGRYEEGEKLYNELKTVMEKADIYDLLNFKMRAGNLFLVCGQFEKTVELLEPCVYEYEALGQEIDEAIAKANVGLCHLHCGNYRQANAFLSSAHTIFHRKRLSIQKYRVQANMVSLDTKTGHFNRALKRIPALLSFFKKQGLKRDVVQVLYHQMETSFMLGAYRETLPLTKQVYEGYISLGIPSDALQARILESSCLFHLGQQKRALKGLKECEEECRKINDMPLLLRILILKAEQEIASDDREAFERTLRAFHDITRHQEYPERNEILIAKSHLYEAMLYYRKSDEKLARKALEKAYDEVHSTYVPELKWRIDYLGGLVAEMEVKHHTAYRKYLSALKRIERTRKDLIPFEEQYFDFLTTRSDVYESLVRICLKTNTEDKLKEALKYIELARSRALIDAVIEKMSVEQKHGTKQEQALYDEYEAVKSELLQISSKLDSTPSDGKRGGRSTTSTEVRHRQDRLRTLGLQLWQSSLSSKTQSLKSIDTDEAFNLDKVQDSLSENQAVIEFFTVDNQYYAFVIDKAGLKVSHPLSTVPDLTSVIDTWKATEIEFYETGYLDHSQHFTNQLENADYLLEKLYRLLLKPIENLLEGKRSLIIVPHGNLWHVPFTALRHNDTSLCSFYAVQMLPCMALIPFLKERTFDPETEDKALFVSGEAQLKSETELSSLQRNFGEVNIFAKKRVDTGNLKYMWYNYSVIHCAGHCILKPDSPYFSYLDFKQYRLYLNDLYLMQLNAKLVTLAACESALGTVTSGQEVIGFARTFILAGAASLMLTLWKVEDKVTGEFMDLFYGHLKATGSCPEALRQAQIELSQKYPHPYYWAGFVWVGFEGGQSNA